MKGTCSGFQFWFKWWRANIGVLRGSRASPDTAVGFSQSCCCGKFAWTSSECGKPTRFQSIRQGSLYKGTKEQTRPWKQVIRICTDLRWPACAILYKFSFFPFIISVHHCTLNCWTKLHKNNLKILYFNQRRRLKRIEANVELQEQVRVYSNYSGG